VPGLSEALKNGGGYVIKSGTATLVIDRYNKRTANLRAFTIYNIHYLSPSLVSHVFDSYHIDLGGRDGIGSNLLAAKWVLSSMLFLSSHIPFPAVQRTTTPKFGPAHDR
jgi:hypothetical protein